MVGAVRSVRVRSAKNFNNLSSPRFYCVTQITRISLVSLTYTARTPLENTNSIMTMKTVTPTLEHRYGHVKKIKKFKSIPRTEGVSTTDIVGRMLLCTKTHHQVEAGQNTNNEDDIFDSSRSSTFYTTSSLLQQFSLNARPRNEGESVVYIDGAWDLFHAGHSKILEKAREFGDYVIVGVRRGVVHYEIQKKIEHPRTNRYTRMHWSTHDEEEIFPS